MLKLFVLPLLAVLSFTSFAVAQGACNASDFAAIACLTSDNGAASTCSMAPRPTITLTVTTTTLDINTQILTAHATSQATVNVTKTEMSTKTITTGPVQTITNTETELRTENIAFTTYVQPALEAAAINRTCNPSDALSALGALPSDSLITACSCIGKRIPARTTTVIVTAPAVQTRTTDFAGTAPTTTLYEIVRQTTTVTKPPTKFITLTTSICITSTNTVSYAAPTFTSVFGPKAGCAGTASEPHKPLDAAVRDIEGAAQECQNICIQDSHCSFVYVQRLSIRRGGTPYFQCTFNDRHLEISDDLACGKDVGIYGVAMGYDAYGRAEAL